MATFISSSEPYISDDETWCVQKARVSARWMNIVDVFTKELWTAICCSLIIITVIIYVMIHLEKLNQNIYWAFLRGLTVSLGMATTFKPRRFYARFIFVLFLLYGMIIDLIFSCFLVTTLTKERFQTQVTTLQEAVGQEFTFAGGNLSWAHIQVHNDSVWLEQHILKSS